LSDELRLLRESVSALLEDYCTPADIDAAIARGIDVKLWAVLEKSGFTLLSVPEPAGGGGTLREAATIVSAAAEFAAPVPVAETALLGGWLFAEAGLPLPAGPLTAALAPHDFAVAAAGNQWSVRGRLSRVPWARAATSVAVLAAGSAGGLVVSVDPAACALTPGANLASEPRDDLLIETTVGPDQVASAPVGAGDSLRRRGALARAIMLAGAADRALALTVQHATQREQFGRLIGGFQAIQQQVAEMAAEVAMMRVAINAAVEVCVDAGIDSAPGAFAVAAAKGQTSHAAGLVARIAHQVHGAIGMTSEHALRLTTTRLWSWRDESGNEAAWFTDIGERALVAGEQGLWALIAEKA
jgi:acyl-CoA dehydrogenase